MREPAISKPLDDIDDIILILLIVESDYNNYVHYRNIELCYDYVKKTYDKNSPEKKNDEPPLKQEFCPKENLKFEGCLNSECKGNGKECHNGELVFEGESSNGKRKENDIPQIPQGSEIKMFKDNSFNTNYFYFDNITVMGDYNAGYHNSKINKGKGLLIQKGIEEFIETGSKLDLPLYKRPYSYIDTIDIIYEMPNGKSIEIFGEKFVSSYKNKCKIIHKGKTYPLNRYFLLSKDDFKDKDFTIKLTGINLITDMGYMFYKIRGLKSLPNISKIDTSKITNMRSMFEECLSLETLPNMERWNVEKVNSMRGMFYYCEKLKSLPGIDKWNPINLTTCYVMFLGCKELPNSETSKIEKWENVNENIRKEAFLGYKYGVDTEYLPHCLIDNYKRTTEVVKNFLKLFKNKT